MDVFGGGGDGACGGGVSHGRRQEAGDFGGGGGGVDTGCGDFCVELRVQESWCVGILEEVSRC